MVAGPNADDDRLRADQPLAYQLLMPEAVKRRLASSGQPRARAGVSR